MVVVLTTAMFQSGQMARELFTHQMRIPMVRIALTTKSATAARTALPEMVMICAIPQRSHLLSTTLTMPRRQLVMNTITCMKTPF